MSIEGDRESHDARRGKGSYQKAMDAMDILHRNHLPFGISCCYTSKNIPSICSDEFIDKMIEKGAYFAWYFHYMPVGNDASIELLPSVEQREYMYEHIRAFRDEKSLFIMDFQNDGEFVGLCSKTC